MANLHKKICLVLLLLLGVKLGMAQDHNVGEFIVQLKPKASVSGILESINRQLPDVGLRTDKCLSKALNIYLLSSSVEAEFETDLLELLERERSVVLAQFNHTNLSLRAVPNDPDFDLQWSLLNDGTNGGSGMADIDASSAWDITTGGNTVIGDTIVVAVVDGGFDLDHEDLVDNWYINRMEIAGNSLDDDGNGYVDDVQGWNFYTNSPQLPLDNHGTHVAGTVGAKGNNATGVSGVNWNVKMLPLAASTTQEAIVVEAYAYIYEMRKRYNASNGLEGAYIVVANSSFGADFKFPEDSPIWCNMYDSLGAVGVLSVGATVNLGINVDVEGDIPSTCPSSYLLAVTNTTSADELKNGAGYGPQSIDLGAPGTDIYSTRSFDSYGYSTGTSMSAPHVAGAIALMYSNLCPATLEEYRFDPAGLALFVKNKLMSEGVSPVPTLMGKSVSGGRLDLFKAVASLNETCIGVAGSVAPSACDTCNGAISLNAIGGEAPYSYVWSSGDTTPVLQNLCIGIYEVTVTDGNGLSVVRTFAVSNDSGPTVVPQLTHVSCPGGADGAIVLTGAAHYLWEDADTSNMRAQLSPGTYVVSATDSGTCTTVLCLKVLAPDSISMAWLPTPPTSQMANGILEVEVAGGTPPYAFQWSNAGSTNPLVGIAEGEYQLTITDARGCKATDSLYFPFPVGVAAVDELTDFQLFPNPVADWFSVKSDYPINRFTIFDQHGRIMLDRKVSSIQFFRIDAAGFPSGIYLLRLNSEKKEAEMKFIKQ